MSGWGKLLARMLADRDPRNYTYDDAARVLKALGFEPAKTKPKGSHRVWRLEYSDGNVQRAWIVGLVDEGHGKLKPVYIRSMLKELDRAGLVGKEIDRDDKLDD